MRRDGGWSLGARGVQEESSFKLGDHWTPVSSRVRSISFRTLSQATLRDKDISSPIELRGSSVSASVDSRMRRGHLGPRFFPAPRSASLVWLELDGGSCSKQSPLDQRERKGHPSSYTLRR